jgi:hypothetical protein
MPVKAVIGVMAGIIRAVGHIDNEKLWELLKNTWGKI